MLNAHEIGGALVEKALTIGGERRNRGSRLTAEEVRSMPEANRRSFVSNGFITPWPAVRSAPTEVPERHVINSGFGKFDVIEGRKLNTEPLTKDEALELASAPALSPT